MRNGPPPAESRRLAFEALYQRHHREVWAVAYARRLDADLALEVTQEVFLRLWKQWQSGEVIENPRAWLMRVARNFAEDHAKSAFRRHGTQSPDAFAAVRSATASPSELLEHAELLGQVRDALNELQEADRAVLTLRYALDYEVDQIAEVLDINVAAVHMRLSRARKRVAERLADRGVKSPP
jgi:RNA polymerase sigma-70 factor (ECF subfamily)